MKVNAFRKLLALLLVLSLLLPTVSSLAEGGKKSGKAKEPAEEIENLPVDEAVEELGDFVLGDGTGEIDEGDSAVAVEAPEQALSIESEVPEEEVVDDEERQAFEAALQALGAEAIDESRIAEGDWEYVPLSNGAMVVGYAGKGKAIEIPSRLGGLSVIAVGDNILPEKTKVKRIYVPGNVRSIADGAFKNAAKLKLEGYNGTEALRFAARRGIKAVNRSKVKAEGFDEDTVDYSYAEEGRVRVVDDGLVVMGEAEAALLRKGSAFFVPGYNGLVYVVLKLTRRNGDVEVEVEATAPKNASGLSEGDWIYEIVGGYANILGYRDTSVKKLTVPDKLGNRYVNSIGSKAFKANKALKKLTVHGNVVSIADDAFASKDVKLLGYNGTEVLDYARRRKMPYKNLTNLTYYELQEHVVDFSYAPDNRYDYVSEYVIKMRRAEAAQLGVGSMFYVPMYYGDLMKLYKVDDIVEDGAWVLLSVEAAKSTETLISTKAENVQLFPDWGNAVWADGVEVIDEKGLLQGLKDAWNWGKTAVKKVKDAVSEATRISRKHAISADLVKMRVEFPLAKGLTKSKRSEGSAKLFGEFGVNLTGELSYDISVLPYEVHSYSTKVEATATLKGGLEFGMDRSDSDDRKKKDQSTKLKEYQTADMLLGKLPLVSAAGVATLSVDMYLHVGIDGQVVITTKGTGTILDKTWDKDKGDISKPVNFKWDTPEIDAGVTIEIGPKFALSLSIAVIGDLVSLEIFAGVCIDFQTVWGGGSVDSASGGQWESYDITDVCADLKVSLVFSIDVSVKLPWFNKVWETGKGKNKKTTKKKSRSSGVGINIWENEKELFTKHWESFSMDNGHHGFVDECTRGNRTIHFVTGTDETIEDVYCKKGHKIKEPTLTKTIGTLDGWYYYTGCSGPGEYKTGKGKKIKWDFATSKVGAEDITLYAEWVSDKVGTVTYHWNYGNTLAKNKQEKDFKSDNVPVGALLTAPGNIMRMNYVLDGWFTEAACTTQWNFNYDVMPDKSNLDLYAKWTYQENYDPWDVKTQDGNYDVYYNGHGYTHIMEYMSFSSADAYARSLGGYLATINSQDEQDFLAKYLYDDCDQEYLWLGIKNNKNWDYWYTGEKVTYTNWNSAPGSGNDHTYGALIRVGGQWTTLANNETAHFVIEFGNADTDPDYDQKVAKKDIFNYEVGANGEATVTGWNQAELDGFLGLGNKNVAISGTYEEDGKSYPVTAIADDAMKNCSSLKSVSLPSSIKTIGNNAFRGCTNLEYIYLPGSVDSVGSYAFADCPAMKKADWGDKMTSVSVGAFQNCSSLATVTGLRNVTVVEECAFDGCGALVNFAFPDKLKEIHRRGFYRCGSLRSLSLPDSVTTIGYDAFSECVGATIIYVPGKVKTIEDYAFNNCNNVSRVYLSSTITEIRDNAFNRVDKATYHVYKEKGGKETHTYKWCVQKNKKISLLDGKRRVRYAVGEVINEEPDVKAGSMVSDVYAAQGARLTEPSVKRAGMTLEGWYLDAAFTKKWDFATGRVPDHGITLYAKWVSNSEDFDYTVTGGVAKVTGYSGSSADVVIPDKLGGYPVKAIGYGAIGGSGIRSVTVPAKVNDIAGGAFSAENLTDIRLRGSSYYSVHDDGVLFNKAGTTLVCVPAGREIAEYVIEDGVKKILSYAFAGHSELAKVTFPASVKTIGANIFGMNHMVEMYGPVGTCAAKSYAAKHGFSYNRYIVYFIDDEDEIGQTSVMAGKLITNYMKPETHFGKFTAWCTDAELTQPWNFKTDKMPDSDLTLYLKWDSLFRTQVKDDGLVITGYKGSDTNVVVPEEIMGTPVVGIAKGAFSAAKYKSVAVPDCVTSIAKGAFNSKLTLMGNKGSAVAAFAKKYKQKFSLCKYTITFNSMGGTEVKDMQVEPGSKIKLPSTVRSNYYFFGWYRDTSFTDEMQWTSSTQMPAENVTLYALWRVANPNLADNFGYKVLSGGKAEITGYGGEKAVLRIPDTINGYTVTRIGAGAFANNDTLQTVILPKTVTVIAASAFAESAVQVVKGSGNVTSIGDSAFSGASALRSIDTSHVAKIGDSAFAYCTSLTGMQLKSGLTSIGSRAFYGCSNLDYVTLPDTLTTLGKGAFQFCPRLKKAAVPEAVRSGADEAFDQGVTLTGKASAAVRVQSSTRTAKNKLKVTWNKVNGATSYKLMRKLSTESAFKQVQTAKGTSATVTAPSGAKSMEVKVVAVDKKGKTISTSAAVSFAVTSIGTPSVTSVQQLTESSARMTLKTVSGAAGYEIWRANTEDGEYKLLKSVTSGRFTNTGLVGGGDYYYKVRGYTGSGKNIKYGNWSDVYKFHMPSQYVTAPINVYARQIGDAKVRVSWDQVENASEYVVYRSANGGSYAKVAETSNLSADISGLKKGVNYGFKVKAAYYEGDQRRTGNSSTATQLKLKTLGTPEITAIRQSQNKAVVLKWSAVKGAKGYTVYRGTSKNGKYTKVKNVTGTSLTITSGIAAGKTYYFKVRAYKGSTQGEVSRPVSLAVGQVATVGGLTVSQQGSSKAKLKWTGVSGAAGYEVYGSVNGSTQYEKMGKSTRAELVLSNLGDGVKYSFCVRAYRKINNKNVYGSYSSPVSLQIFALPSITVLEQTATGTAQVVWNRVESADGYEVWYKVAGGKFSMLKRLSATSAYGNNLKANKRYTYKVRAYHLNAAGKMVYTPFSASRTITILAVPTLSSVKQTTSAKATLKWNKISGARGYYVYQATEKNGQYQQIKAKLTKTSCTVEGLKTGKLYYFKVTPYVVVGGKVQLGKASAAKGVRMLGTPTITAVNQSGAKNLTLHWNKVSHAAGYKVYRAQSAKGKFTLVKTVSGTSVTIAPLSQKKTYYFKVAAYSKDSNAASTGLTSPAKSGYVTTMKRPAITWIEQQTTPSAADVQWGKISGAKGYALYVSGKVDGSYTLKATTKATHLKVTGLKKDKTYYYKVRPYTTLANGSKVYGMYSSAAAFTRKGAPTGVKASRRDQKSVTLTWNAVNGATAYRIYRSTNASTGYKPVKVVKSTTAACGDLKSGKTYYFKVAAVMNTNGYRSIGVKSASAKVLMVNLGAVSLKSWLQTGSGKVKLTWAALKGAQGYQVYRAKGDEELKLVKTLTGTSLVMSGLEDTATYKFRVRAYKTVGSQKGYGSYSKTVSLQMLSAPTLQYVYQGNTSGTSVYAEWQSVNGATGYELHRKNSKGVDRVAATTKELFATDKGTAAGSKYTYRVRAYQTIGGKKSYGPYSTAIAFAPVRFSEGKYPESEHDYANNMDQTWTYRIPKASALAIKFTQETLFENYYDKLYVMDANDNVIGTYSGNQLAGATVKVPGSTVKLRMTSDGGSVRYGFKIESIRPAAN